MLRCPSISVGQIWPQAKGVPSPHRTAEHIAPYAGMLLPHTSGSVTNIHGADTVSVGAISAIRAEIHSGVCLMLCSADRASLACVLGVNIFDLNARQTGLVLNEHRQPIETPGVQGRVVFTACSCRAADAR